MKKTNNKIIDEVKQFVNSVDLKKNNINEVKDDEIIANLVEEKIDTLDKTIQKEIKVWISLNAEDISKKIINDAVKKVFK
tara:strand:+ start:138 stop:377 length:240 start_codon:yes stop_codon:yes gene_type:complete